MYSKRSRPSRLVVAQTLMTSLSLIRIPIVAAVVSTGTPLHLAGTVPSSFPTVPPVFLLARTRNWSNRKTAERETNGARFLPGPPLLSPGPGPYRRVQRRSSDYVTVPGIPLPDVGPTIVFRCFPIVKIDQRDARGARRSRDSRRIAKAVRGIEAKSFQRGVTGIARKRIVASRSRATLSFAGGG